MLGKEKEVEIEIEAGMSRLLIICVEYVDVWLD